MLAIWTKSDVRDTIGVFAESGEFCKRLRIPNLYVSSHVSLLGVAPRARGRCEAFAVGAKRNGPRGGPQFESLGPHGRLDIPNLHRKVARCAGQALTVGAKRYFLNRAVM